VQVQMHVADDLSPAARTVYRLACQIRDADRSRDQKTEVGDALQQLIAGADHDGAVACSSRQFEPVERSCVLHICSTATRQESSRHRHSTRPTSIEPWELPHPGSR